jgi:hypothetical protein
MEITGFFTSIKNQELNYKKYNMKNKNAFYWIITSLFGAFMIFTSIPDIIMSPDAVSFMNILGYPDYFIPFIGVAKILGVIAILIPGYPRIKEWAYAGLAYDLIGAIYSVVATNGLDFSMFFMLLPVTLLVLSYNLFHRKYKRELQPA